MKKSVLFLGSLFAFVLLAVLVYAFAFDTDGGDNVFVKGTCTDNNGNHTDICLSVNGTKLVEFYPSSNNTNATCISRIANCGDFNLTCFDGHCG